MFYAITYALMATVAFGMILLLARAGFEAEEIDDFKGLNQRNPWYAGDDGAGDVFAGRRAAAVRLLRQADGAEAPRSMRAMLWLAIVAIVFAIIGLFYYLRVVKVMYFDDAAERPPLPLPSDRPFRWVLSVNGVALLVLGVAWGPLLDWCNARILYGLAGPQRSQSAPERASNPAWWRGKPCCTATCQRLASRADRLRARLMRGGAVWQLVGLITRRSQVQILPPLPGFLW